MPEVIFPGPAGKLEGRYNPPSCRDAPMALLLHAHPQLGGTMNTKVVYHLYHTFLNLGFAVLRFNFRGVGRSHLPPHETTHEDGVDELSDAASALDFLQSMHGNARQCWVMGFSFGAWVGMRLLMRRPEITGFVCVAPRASAHDFSFLAPCPASGLFISGSDDQIAPAKDTARLIAKLKQQRGVKVMHTEIKGAGHFFDGPHMQALTNQVSNYVKERTQSD